MHDVQDVAQTDDTHMHFLIVVSLPLLLLSVALEDRKRVQQQVREKELQLAHLNRVATLGALSGALAHELNQPLAAILGMEAHDGRLWCRSSSDRGAIFCIALPART